MGNKNIQIQQTQFNSQEYRQIRRESNGVVLSHLQTHQSFFLREMNYGNQIDYKHEKQRLITQLNKEQNQNILKIIKVWGKQYNNFCSTTYKVFSVYELPEITLYDEIMARKKENRYFEQCDLWSILQSCCNGLVDLKPSISIEPNKIFILSDGLLKLIHNDMTNQEYRCIVNEEVYYAPEKINNFNKPDRMNTLQKQAIFSMGMTILQAALLNDVCTCYNYKNLQFLQDKLEDMIQNLHERYSEQFIQTLATILQQNPNRRPSMIEIQDILNQKWNNQQTLSMKESIQQQQNILPKQQKQSFGETYVNSSIKNSYKPLQQIKNKVEVSKKQNYQRFTYEKFIPQSKQNLFTDPKLLEMIRCDLQNIKTMKRKSQLQFMQYTNSKLKEDSSKQSIDEIYNQQKKQNVQQNQRNQKQSNVNIVRETYEDQSTYQGSKVNGKKHGMGKLFYPDGAYYEGQFSHDHMHGFGTLYYRQNYPAYKGQWLQDHFHGEGTLYNQTPVQLNQQFNFEDFNVVQDYWVKYEGTFVLDNKCGIGKLTLSNGEVFTGQFQKDCINGRGQYLNMEGQTIRGIWESNNLIEIDQE